MQRRTAIKNMILVSAGISILPACNFSGTPLPTYTKLPLEKDQWKFIDQLSAAILPRGEAKQKPEESSTHFLLTVLNDCHTPKEITSYLAGLKEVQSYATTNFKTGLPEIKEEQLKTFWTYLSEGEERSEALQEFYNTTRGLTLKHFTSSEDFLEKYTDFDFVPSRYSGCMKI